MKTSCGEGDVVVEVVVVAFLSNTSTWQDLSGMSILTSKCTLQNFRVYFTILLALTSK